MKLLNADAAELHQKLTQYLHDDPTFRAVFTYTQERFYKATNLPAHNWAHVYRDILNAIVVGEAEKADMGVVLPAITMHDIGFLYGANGKTHGAVGAEKLHEYLHDGNIKYPPKIIESIADCIRTHKGSMHNEKPASLEAKVVADADLIEKFGPIGVYQNIRTFTEFNWPLEKNLARATEIFDLTLETPTGRSIAEKGRQFVADFYNELAEATSPYSKIVKLD
ncbi:MAG TPA: HD domain-containing protein [Candidatus Saccharimonadales bacterium]|nr:HD domain-containing protein [Candidatus Saccharimonadales bacterium]